MNACRASVGRVGLAWGTPHISARAQLQVLATLAADGPAQRSATPSPVRPSRPTGPLAPIPPDPQGVIYAGSAAGLPQLRGPALAKAASFKPGHFLMDKLGPAIAVDPDVLWHQLPTQLRNWVEKQDGESQGGDGARGEAVAAFIRRRGGRALRLVPGPPGRSRQCASLSHGWRAALVQHGLFRAVAGRLQDRVEQCLAQEGQKRAAWLGEIMTPTADLYGSVSVLEAGPWPKEWCFGLG
jgi:hypothetical protein